VAEAVDAAVAGNPGPFLQALHHGGNRLRRKPSPLVGEPEPLQAVGAVHQVAVQGLPRLALQGEDPHLRPLAQHLGLLELGVEVGELDTGELGEPEPGVGEHGDNRLVAAAEEAGAGAELVLAAIEHGHDLAVGVGLDLAVVGGGELESPDAVLGEVLLLVGGPAEQPLYHPPVVVDGGRGCRSARGAGAVLIPPAVPGGGDVVKEVPQVLPGDLAGVFGPALPLGVPQQVIKADPEVALGVGGEVAPGEEVALGERSQGNCF